MNTTCHKRRRFAMAAVGLAVGAVWVATVGCRSNSNSAAVNTIRVEGSDTMLSLAQAWAERYQASHPQITIQVSGGGSGVGIASLMEGVTDLANSSRKIRDSERARARQSTGKEVVETVVGMDALAICVHADNPLETISLSQLAEIYGENGSISKWSELDVQDFGCDSDEITRVSRQNNSGTYHYFREAVLGENREFALGSIDQSGSKDVVSLVAHTPCAIGYTGMGYLTEDVKALRVSKTPDGEGQLPSIASVATGTYPIARPLLIYTLGAPAGIIKDYLDWIHSAEGQNVLTELGYISLRESGDGHQGDADQEAVESAAPLP